MEQLKVEMRSVFISGMEEVVLPAIETSETKIGELLTSLETKLAEQISEVKEIATDTAQSVDRIERRQNADQKLVDNLDREVERLLEHTKLKPLPLEP